MPEDLGARPPVSRIESVESPRSRDLAVDYAGYFGVHVAGRGEYDRSSDRLGPLRIIVEKYPDQADRIRLLDAHLERAYELKRGFFTDRTPSYDRDPDTDMRTRFASFFGEPRPRVTIPGTPPDYTFSSVRHPVARPLLDLINIAIAVDNDVADNPRERADKLKSNGDRMVQKLVGEDRDPKALLRITDVAVLEAIFDGRLELPAKPGEPLTPDTGIRVGSDELPDQTQD